MSNQPCWQRCPTAEEAALEAFANEHWRHTRGGAGRKIVCPECGQTGYRHGCWIWGHLHHDTTPCGKKVAAGRVGQHQGRCKDCAALTHPTPSPLSHRSGQ